MSRNCPHLRMIYILGLLFLMPYEWEYRSSNLRIANLAHKYMRKIVLSRVCLRYHRKYFYRDMRGLSRHSNRGSIGYIPNPEYKGKT